MTDEWKLRGADSHINAEVATVSLHFVRHGVTAAPPVEPGLTEEQVRVRAREVAHRILQRNAADLEELVQLRLLGSPSQMNECPPRPLLLLLLPRERPRAKRRRVRCQDRELDNHQRQHFQRRSP